LGCIVGIGRKCVSSLFFDAVSRVWVVETERDMTGLGEAPECVPNFCFLGFVSFVGLGSWQIKEFSTVFEYKTQTYKFRWPLRVVSCGPGVSDL
jgi:hypothetical protein